MRALDVFILFDPNIDLLFVFIADFEYSRLMLLRPPPLPLPCPGRGPDPGPPMINYLLRILLLMAVRLS